MIDDQRSRISYIFLFERMPSRVLYDINYSFSLCGTFKIVRIFKNETETNIAQIEFLAINRCENIEVFIAYKHISFMLTIYPINA